ncbi:coiled-coil domain-containing protein 107 [Heterocephalus glaber]|uniref:Coiled-coil domain-containing protein 107 n=1 Tax=Heterocephalus glaber TaxID=10181 RepID=A0AAX6QC63_HETGA|nr:coiled-coil domain-containing protein 107 [Heterocephalus glaber]
MAGAVSLLCVLWLLLVSALVGVLGECPSRHHTAHPGHCAQVGPGATEPWQRLPPKDQREPARALPWGALYTAGVVAFVLYKCLQGKDEVAVLQEEKGKKESLQSEQELAQLTQQLAQTEQHLNVLMAQLDPLFEHVTTLVGTERELLDKKLQTIHQLLQDCKPENSVEAPESEASIPFPEDLRIKEEEEEEEEEAGDSQAWKEPVNWNTQTWNLATSWQLEQGVRKRCTKPVTKSPRHSSSQEGRTTTEGLVKPSLFL